MNKKLGAALAAAALVTTLGACSNTSEMEQRTAAQNAKKAKTNSLEMQNLKRKIELEEKPNQIGYVYLVSFAKPMGYYVVKGKVSSSGSQLTPENDIVWTGTTSGHVVTDGPQDDGTYGTGDPGIFFFTSDGVMVHTSLDYVYSTQPLAIDVPLLGGK